MMTSVANQSPTKNMPSFRMLPLTTPKLLYSFSSLCSQNVRSTIPIGFSGFRNSPRWAASGPDLHNTGLQGLYSQGHLRIEPGRTAYQETLYSWVLRQETRKYYRLQFQSRTQKRKSLHPPITHASTLGHPKHNAQAFAHRE